MKVNKPTLVSNSVRADSSEAKNGFGYEALGEYEYFVPVSDNSCILYIRRSLKKGQSIFIEPEYVLVFNVKNNTMGIVKANQMVEPVNFSVNVETK